MKLIELMLVSLFFAQQGAAVGKVESKFDKTTNFAGLHTYSWTPGSKTEIPQVGELIVAACDQEMAKLGFTKVPNGADVTLAFYTVRSTEVDLKALDKLEKNGGGGPTPTKTLGRLVVVMRSGAGSAPQLWSASTREFVDPDPARLGDTIHTVAARLFETYPRAKRP